MPNVLPSRDSRKSDAAFYASWMDKLIKRRDNYLNHRGAMLEYKDRLTYSLCIVCSLSKHFFCFINKAPSLSDPLTYQLSHFNIHKKHSYFGFIIALCSWIFPAEMLIWVCFSSTRYTTTTATRFVFYIVTYYIRQNSSNAVQGFYCYYRYPYFRCRTAA